MVARKKPEAKTSETTKPVSTSPARQAVSSSFKAFNLNRDVEGKTIPVVVEYPTIGDTGHKLYIRSRYSKAYREAEAASLRRIRAMTVAKGAEIDEDILEDIRMRAFCALVESWTFEEECTPENVIEFLTVNSLMYDKVNNAAAKDEDFFNSRANS